MRTYSNVKLDIAQNIRKLRKQKGLLQARLLKSAVVSYNAAIESASAGITTLQINTFQKLAKNLIFCLMI
jgi:transcriptional regulator with XRE-family HTH domain